MQRSGLTPVNSLAPIVLFVFNRPWHTRMTLESLMANEPSERSELYIFADGPKENASGGDLASIQEVRCLIREKQWCRNVHIIESERNLGLAASVIAGTTQVVNEFGKAIILEDDLITSPYFLDYMNRALLKYQDLEEVMQICGYMLPIDHRSLRETFFLRLTSSWGWSTWSRAWKYFEADTDKLEKTFASEDIQRFNLDGAYDYYSFFKLHREGKISSWAVLWYASVFLRKGLCLHPSRSLVYNCGHDDSGTHSPKTNIFETHLNTQLITDFNDQVQEDREAIKRIQNYYCGCRKSMMGNMSIVRRLFQGFNKL